MNVFQFVHTFVPGHIFWVLEMSFEAFIAWSFIQYGLYIDLDGWSLIPIFFKFRNLQFFSYVLFA